MTATNPSPRVVRECTLPWSKVDTTVMRDPSLSLGARTLYGVLTTFVDRNSRTSDTDPDGPDVPTRGSLAECLGKSRDTVDRLTAELEAYRLNGAPILVVERRRDPDRPKSHLPSVYRLLDHEHWDALAAERHAARQSARGSRKSAATPSEGGRMDAARGSRKSAARGGRMDAAVPITTQRTTTHRVREDVNVEASATGSGAGGGVEESENLGALREVLRGDAYEALTLDERCGLAAAVRRLIDAGWTTAQIRARKPDRRVNGSTTHPATHIRKALETLAAEPAPGATPTASASRTVADDCDQCDVNGWATVDDGTPNGLVVRCAHDGTTPAAAPEPDPEPARVDEARAMFAELAHSLGAA